jgi:gas vesicle protein
LTLFGTGLLVGSAVGLLFAPRPGKELREDLGRRIQQAPEAFARIPERAAELTQRAGEVVGNVRDQVRETANQVATKAEGIGREAQPRADQTRTGGHSA